MGLKQLLKFLPLVASVVHAQTDDAVTDDAITDTATNNTIVSAPIYTPDECDSWIGYLGEKDSDGTGGLSENEYFSFLSGIEDPPYIAAFFSEYLSFDSLPWVFRVVHKSLACHCEKLGYGENCCEGDRAEVKLDGLDGASDSNAEYKDLFCQQIAYVFTKSVPSPQPTVSPTTSPSGMPSEGPSDVPSMPPSPSPSMPPTESSGPTPSPTDAPTVSLSPTASPTVNVTLTIAAVEAAPMSEPEPEEDKFPVGALVGAIIAVIAIILLVTAFVIYRRRQEEDQLRKFAGDQAPEADLEAPPTDVDELEQAPMPKTAADGGPGDAPGEDDESSAPSVWSESDNGSTVDEGMLEDNEDPGVTAGSALAAMGAASTVAARIGSSK
mmetsp:Transcript_36094/g.75991  ORF Transcript_36094/g.75991 Transcript_36094/m.75991 type:complete len:382 (-) Transcript_36094:345-1490(-)